MQRMKVRKSSSDRTEYTHPTSGKRATSVKSGRAAVIVNMIKSGQVSFLDLRSIRRMLRNG